MKTFYRKEMSADNNSSYSPSAGKPSKFINYLLRKGVELDICDSFPPISKEMLYLSHTKEMVNGILALKINNGFGNRSKEIADSLLYTNGSLLAAAKWSYATGENTFSPTSGFHHAGITDCGGFCTFNGLTVVASVLHCDLKLKKIGIVDLDMHFGNGTAQIVKDLKLDFITHYTFGKEIYNHENAQAWLDNLEKDLERFSDCELILYQAGADPHINDPLGGALTTKQMKQRDKIVFEFFHRKQIPVTWNLAGGYQTPLEKVLKLHQTTYELAAKYSRVQKKKTLKILRQKVTFDDLTNWDETINDCAYNFKDHYGVFPNILLASQSTYRKIDIIANNTNKDRIQSDDGKAPMLDEFATLGGLCTPDYSLDFCIDDKLPENTIQLICDSDPDGEDESYDDEEYFDHEYHYGNDLEGSKKAI